MRSVISNIVHAIMIRIDLLSFVSKIKQEQTTKTDLAADFIASSKVNQLTTKREC